jgi:hypothetical protein
MTLELDAATLLTIRNALWLTQQQIAAADACIMQQLQALAPEKAPEKPLQNVKANGVHP